METKNESAPVQSYVTPSVRVVKVTLRTAILGTSDVDYGDDGNEVGFKPGGGGEAD